MSRVAFRAMGSEICATVDDGDARATLSEVEHWFRGWERCLSRFEPGSELSALNRARQATGISDTLWSALDAALQAADATGGAITPTMLAQLEAAGYRHSFVRDAEVEHEPGALPAPAADHRRIARDHAAHAVKLPEGVQLDLGGTAKGWAADRAAERLAALGPAQVNAGGDVAMSGHRAGEACWEIAVESPLEPGAMLGVLAVRGGGVATSGRHWRRWKRGGVWQHHLIDPRTGLPAVTDVLSATVVGPGALSAEVAAKHVLLLGSDAGLRWLDAQPALSGLVVLESGEVRESRRLGLDRA